MVTGSVSSVLWWLMMADLIVSCHSGRVSDSEVNGAERLSDLVYLCVWPNSSPWFEPVALQVLLSVVLGFVLYIELLFWQCHITLVWHRCTGSHMHCSP